MWAVYTEGFWHWPFSRDCSLDYIIEPKCTKFLLSYLRSWQTFKSGLIFAFQSFHLHAVPLLSCWERNTKARPHSSSLLLLRAAYTCVDMLSWSLLHYCSSQQYCSRSGTGLPWQTLLPCKPGLCLHRGLQLMLRAGSKHQHFSHCLGTALMPLAFFTLKALREGTGCPPASVSPPEAPASSMPLHRLPLGWRPCWSPGCTVGFAAWFTYPTITWDGRSLYQKSKVLFQFDRVSQWFLQTGAGPGHYQLLSLGACGSSRRWSLCYPEEVMVLLSPRHSHGSRHLPLEPLQVSPGFLRVLAEVCWWSIQARPHKAASWEERGKFFVLHL